MAIEIFGGLLEASMIRGDYFDSAVAMVALWSIPTAVRRSGVEGYDARYKIFDGVPLLRDANDEHWLEAASRRIIEGELTGGTIIRAFGIVNGLESEPDIAGFVDSFRQQTGAHQEHMMGNDLYLKMLVAQVHPEQVKRVEARKWLVSRSESKPGTWIDAWCRLALGVSFLNESEGPGGDEMLSRGVVQLTHVYVRLGERYPGLARKAVELAVEGLLRSGRYEEASELMRGSELRVLGSR
jgi:hypothetical protein